MPTTLQGQPIDNRTPELALPLPHIDNWHEDDVPRLRTAFTLIDTACALLSGDLAAKASQGALDALQASTNAALTLKAGQADLTALQGSTDAALALKASADALNTAVADLNAALALKAPSTTPTVTGLREVRAALGAGVQIDLAAGNLFTKTVAGATAFTLANVPGDGTVASFMLDLTNGGSAAVTWWPGCQWSAGVAPVLTPAGRDLLGFVTHDGGATWLAMRLGKDLK
jgi:hypothetical protein